MNSIKRTISSSSKLRSTLLFRQSSSSLNNKFIFTSGHRSNKNKESVSNNNNNNNSTSTSSSVRSTRRTATSSWFNFWKQVSDDQQQQQQQQQLNEKGIADSTSPATTDTLNKYQQQHHQQRRLYSNENEGVREEEEGKRQRRSYQHGHSAFSPFKHLIFLAIAYQLAGIDVDKVIDEIGLIVFTLRALALKSKLPLEVTDAIESATRVQVNIVGPRKFTFKMSEIYIMLLDIMESLTINHQDKLRRILSNHLEKKSKMDQPAAEYGSLGICSAVSNWVMNNCIDPSDYSKLPIERIVRMAGATQIPFPCRAFLIQSINIMATNGDSVTKLRLANAGAIPILEFMASYKTQYTRDYKHAIKLISKTAMINSRLLKPHVEENEIQVMKKYSNEPTHVQNLLNMGWISTAQTEATQSTIVFGLLYGVAKMWNISGAIFTSAVGSIVAPFAVKKLWSNYIDMRKQRTKTATTAETKSKERIQDTLLIYSVYPAYLLVRTLLAPYTTAWLATTTVALFYTSNGYVNHNTFIRDYYTKSPTLENIPRNI